MQMQIKCLTILFLSIKKHLWHHNTRGILFCKARKLSVCL